MREVDERTNKEMVSKLTAQHMRAKISTLVPHNLSTILHESIRLRDSDSVLSLLFINNNIPQIPRRGGSTFLHIAVANCHPEIVEALVNYHLNSDLSAKNSANQTPLDLALKMQKQLSQKNENNNDYLPRKRPSQKIKLLAINRIIEIFQEYNEK